MERGHLWLNPDLAKSGPFTTAVIILLYWLSTIVALGGLNSLSKLSSRFMLVGTLFPAVVLIVLGVVWLLTGHRSEAPLTLSALIPDIFQSSAKVVGHHREGPSMWTEFSGILGGMVLIEIGRAHV